MISRITGILLDLDLKSATVAVGGIGLKVFIGGETLEYMAGNIGQTVELFTYLAVRENALDLYGFKNRESLEMFELLLTVSGIGPKSALAILAVASEKTIREAVTNEDTSYLTKVSGVGKKNAEKIVLELKGKLKDSEIVLEGRKDVSKDTLVIEALKSLGFDERSARESIKHMDKELTAEAMIKLALKDIKSPFA